MSCAKSVDVIVPVFNRDLAIIEYVIVDFLKQNIDRVIIANTGEKETGLADNKRIIEAYATMPSFYPGFTRNMGASVSSANVQVHTGADIITIHGDWGLFRQVDDGEIMSPSCHILNAEETKQALAGIRQFPPSNRISSKSTATIAMTKHTAINLLHGPFCWAMVGWGCVDPDLAFRAVRQGLIQRRADISTAHLFHSGGCEELIFTGKLPVTPEFKRNKRLMDIKATTEGWWSC